MHYPFSVVYGAGASCTLYVIGVHEFLIRVISVVSAVVCVRSLLCWGWSCFWKVPSDCELVREGGWCTTGTGLDEEEVFHLLCTKLFILSIVKNYVINIGIWVICFSLANQCFTLTSLFFKNLYASANRIPLIPSGCKGPL